MPIPDEGVLNSLLWLGIWNTDRRHEPEFRWAVREACRLAEVPRCSPHAFRHSRISIWINLDKCDIRDVMRWAGHSSQRQTEKYIWEMERAVRRPLATKVVDLWETHKLTAAIPIPSINITPITTSSPVRLLSSGGDE